MTGLMGSFNEEKQVNERRGTVLRGAVSIIKYGKLCGWVYFYWCCGRYRTDKGD